MDEIHRKVLQRNRPYLIKEVMLEPLWPYLVAREIFTDEMIEHIQATGAKSSQMQRLLSDLTRRGPKAYPEFLECLVETEQQHIVDKLMAAEETLRAREPKFFTPVMNSTTLGSGSSLSPHGCSSAPTRPLFDHPLPHNNGYHSEPTHEPPTNLTNRSSLRFSAAQRPSNHITTQMKHPLTAATSSTPQEGSMTVSTTGPANDIVSLDVHQPGSSKTVSLTDYITTACGNSSSTTSISYTRPSMSFTAPSSRRQRETTPDRSDYSNTQQLDIARRNLGSMFRSPVTQTDNGDTLTLPGGSDVHPMGIQTTDHPQAVDINPYPQVLGIPQTSGRLKFNVEASQSVSVSPDWNTMYKMNSNPRGYCIIVNNRYFTGHLKERLGTDVDRDNLYMLFSQLGYQICIQENLTGMEMLLTLRDFSQLPHHKTVDSCVVILLTHGLEGQIYGSDSKLINLSEVFNFFDGNVCPGLQGKPKFFLVQACRGEKFDAGFDMPDNGQTDTAGPASQAMLEAQQQGVNDMNSLSRKLPSGSDFLIAYATVPGFVSWRNSEQGSWFIQAMCEVFAKHCKSEDALNMLVQVNNKVATIYESATKHKQMPSPVVLLRKKLFFFPLDVV